MQIQWYPGHMTKAMRSMKEDIKLVDLCIEILDARVPVSSENPDIGELAKNKFRLVILNKADLADPSVTDLWRKAFEKSNIRAVVMDARNNRAMNAVLTAVSEVCREKTERDKKRGLLERPVRAIVAGIPNVGKSTFINSLSGKAVAKTGNKPGVTKGNQWIRLNKKIELLDTPGVLWPKFEDERVGLHLGLIGSINDEVIEKTELAYEFIKMAHANGFLDKISSRYGLVSQDAEGFDPNALVLSIALAKNCIKKGNEPDIEKASSMIIEDYRNGRFGAISLERPEEYGR